MIQALPYGGYDYVRKSSDEILAAADESDFSHFVDLEYTDTMKNERRCYFLRSYFFILTKLTMSFSLTYAKVMRHNHRTVKKLICEWTAKLINLH